MLHIHQIPFSCFFSHTFCICSLSCSRVLLSRFPSVSLSPEFPGGKHHQLSSSWWLPEMNKGNPEHIASFWNMMPEILEERWKLSLSGHLMSCEKIVLRLLQHPKQLIMASCRNWHCIKWIEWRIKYFLNQWKCLFISKPQILLMVLT